MKELTPAASCHCTRDTVRCHHSEQHLPCTHMHSAINNQQHSQQSPTGQSCVLNCSPRMQPHRCYEHTAALAIVQQAPDPSIAQHPTAQLPKLQSINPSTLLAAMFQVATLPIKYTTRLTLSEDMCVLSFNLDQNVAACFHSQRCQLGTYDKGAN